MSKLTKNCELNQTESFFFVDGSNRNAFLQTTFRKKAVAFTQQPMDVTASTFQIFIIQSNF